MNTNGEDPGHGRFEQVTAMRDVSDRPIVAEEWSQLGKGEQIELVVDYHRLARIRLPNLRRHAGLDVPVWGQMGRVGASTPLRLRRIQREASPGPSQTFQSAASNALQM